ncbi:MAG TPA: SDR family oxidoreductase [Tepidisphaeraceae bacterium]|jgi:pteridine reductase
MSVPRLALITGGAKRVGRAIVEKLADTGFDIACTYRSSANEANELKSHVESLGRKCTAIEVDLTHPVQAVEQIAAALAPLSRLDVLVNNASIYHPGKLQDPLTADAAKMWAIHVETPLALCNAFESQLRAARGHVVNMVDLLAERPWPQYLAYSASKAGLWNLTLGLARALAPEVTVNGIAPGVVEWPNDYPESEKEKYLKRVPLARAGTPQDVAEAVAFLCTSGSYMTGQILRLDGGRSIT